jgi:hypothetical protein
MFTNIADDLVSGSSELQNEPDNSQQAVGSSKMLVSSYQTTWPHTLENSTVQNISLRAVK